MPYFCVVCNRMTPDEHYHNMSGTISSFKTYLNIPPLINNRIGNVVKWQNNLGIVLDNSLKTDRIRFSYKQLLHNINYIGLGDLKHV